MNLIQINRNPPRRQLAIFGLVWLVFFGVMGGIVLKRTGSVPTAGAIWGVAGVIPAIGWIAPGFMRIVYLGTTYAAWPIGVVVSYIILAMVYYLVLTPTGWLMRLLGYDPLSRRFDPHAQTYWCPREQNQNREEDQNTNRYFRQF